MKKPGLTLQELMLWKGSEEMFRYVASMTGLVYHREDDDSWEHIGNEETRGTEYYIRMWKNGKGELRLKIGDDFIERSYNVTTWMLDKVIGYINDEYKKIKKMLEENRLSKIEEDF